MRRGRVGFWMRLAEIIARTLLRVFTRPTRLGVEHIPARGPAILVLNHLSYADPLIAGEFIFDRPRDLRFLVKASLFRVPFVGMILRRIKQIPVYRNTEMAGQALEAAVTALYEGHAVVVYPEGTCTKDPGLWPMRGKTGAARLFALTGAPVVPIVQWGAHRIHNPITGRIRLRPRTPVTISAGPAIDLGAHSGRTSPEALREMTDLIMRRLRSDVAELRGEPPPTGPLFVPPPRRPSESSQEVTP